MLEPLSEWRDGQVGAAGGTLIAHDDNARPHTAAAAAAASQQFMEENGMAKSPPNLTRIWHPLTSVSSVT
jgi:hypothetical protein